MSPKTANRQSSIKTFPALRLQETPPVYVVVISGAWLLQHTTPSWRIKDPIKGFQRIVKDERAKAIAHTVLDQGRSFPNAITLATNIKDLKKVGNEVVFPSNVKLLVVDGQHRLWAQRFSNTDGQYACIVHLDKSEKEMAQLFLEINDNQRRVPSSLRWDLVRLVRPEKDEAAVTAADLVFALAERRDSPFYLSIDLTGEQKGESIKQGSLAPEIRTLVARARKKHDHPTTDEYESLLIRFFSAVRSLDPPGWGDPTSTYYRARVLRALLRLLVDFVLEAKSLDTLTAPFFLEQLQKIDRGTLSEEQLRKVQGSAGVADLYQAIKGQVLG